VKHLRVGQIHKLEGWGSAFVVCPYSRNTHGPHPWPSGFTILVNLHPRTKSFGLLVDWFICLFYSIVHLCTKTPNKKKYICVAIIHSHKVSYLVLWMRPGKQNLLNYLYFPFPRRNITLVIFVSFFCSFSHG
jgi:hypothetical protein